MKGLRTILFFLIISACSFGDKNNETVHAFYNTFGKENTKAIDNIVSYADSLLMKNYETRSLNKAYKLFLKEVSSVQIDSLDIGLSHNEISSFVDLFEVNGLKFEIWSFSELNGKEVFEFDMQGAYMKTFEKLQDNNVVAENYFATYDSSGGISYSIFASALIYSSIKFDDYLVRRIIIVDIFYRYCTIKLL